MEQEWYDSWVLNCWGLLIVGFIYFSEQIITPEQFAEVLCDDLELPAASFVPAVAQSIRQQIDSYQPDTILDDPDQRIILKVQISSIYDLENSIQPSFVSL